MHITRLGQGVDRAGAIAPDALDRTLAVLRGYHDEIERFDVERIRMVATSAARDAANRDDFFGAAEGIVGVPVELLDGDDEARLSYLGATAGLPDVEGPRLVFDLGGGSTELALGHGRDVAGTLSIDVGCVRLTERFLEHDPPLPEELFAAISFAQTWIDDVVRLMPEAVEAEQVIGLAGTVSTVAAVEIGLARYDRDRIHHFRLTRDAAEDVFRTLATEPRSERIHNPGLEEARADVIVGGCCALVALYRTLGLDEVLVSESDILDGLALSLVVA
ncbi:MAG: exopolyphosphatase [Actinobacteria bacterium]|nr:exopolyphosphatase [Actinomycetota bacterium]